MIELTTGIVFLLSSMYGAGAPSTDVAVVQPNVDTSVVKTIVITENDKKAVEKYLREHYSDTPILIEIARCESTFTHIGKDGNVIRGKANSADIGVMQINEKYHLITAEKLGYDIYTMEGNVAYAKYLYEKFGSTPWSASSKCWKAKEVAMNK